VEQAQAETIFKRIINDVPDYQVFLTVDELNESSQQLASQYPDTVKLEEIGRSRKGEPIPLLTIGNGRRTALLFGCPHPNEPIGAMMLEYLSWRLATDEALREALDYTWYIIKVVDPDSTRLNEGWFKGPFTPHHYARHFYRPPGNQQVEWTFPIKYKNLNFDSPMPETQALMRVMDRVKPAFMYSLHNAGFGGVYFYMSEEAPPVYKTLHDLVHQQQLPLSLGEPEMPYAEPLATAIYRMPTSVQTYDYYEKYTDIDPATILRSGTSSDDYVRRIANTFTLVCEVPYFYDPRIEDTTPGNKSRREAILENVAMSRDHYQRLRQWWEAAEPLLTAETPFRATIRETLATAEHNLAAKEAWALGTDSLNRPATVAELFDNLEVAAFYQLLSVGVFRRLLEDELQRRAAHGARRDGAAAQLTHILNSVETYFEDRAAWLENALDYRVIPIRHLVRVQLGAALYLMDYVQRQRDAG